MKKPIRFHVITLFPEAIESYCASSVLGAAQIKKIISIKTRNLRLWGVGVHKKVDERPYGGGAGMVLMPEPLIRAVGAIIKNRALSKKRKIVVFSAKGKPWNQKRAYEWSKKFDEFIFVSGRYEGIDERVAQALNAEEISIGPYVLTDGDAPSMVVISSVARLIPGVIKLKSLVEESYGNILKNKKDTSASLSLRRTVEYPQYTRPEVFGYKGKKYRVPKVLLSGDHKKVAEWRKKHMQ